MDKINYILEASPSAPQAHKSGFAEDILEKINKLWPSWPMFIATLLAFALVMLILYFLLYKPVKQSIAKRQAYIQQNIDQAQKNNADSAQILAQANEKLQNAHNEAYAIIANAQRNGDVELEKYINKGKLEAQRLIQEAKIDINLQKQELITQNQIHVANAASLLSRKILKDQVNQESEKKIIDDFFKEH
ncbi:ATP synthase F0 subunit B [Mycoplasmopsis mucosicanis]|uniref:ATP synthase subunit b n=1 Tax=Mycoplasmopsis mucosicanis TaxID=458208 RepID=A0A507SPL5_9BACT|nr:F0F1 ATP synthase subunit B [Mycoplasmopsis mucosicanis]TQC51302.1 ATP synthase F0 subunit B [Mycoplasmopsis mucosicanis]